jgi:hypothetical protein
MEFGAYSMKKTRNRWKRFITRRIVAKVSLAAAQHLLNFLLWGEIPL